MKYASLAMLVALCGCGASGEQSKPAKPIVESARVESARVPLSMISIKPQTVAEMPVGSFGWLNVVYAVPDGRVFLPASIKPDADNWWPSSIFLVKRESDGYVLKMPRRAKLHLSTVETEEKYGIPVKRIEYGETR